MHPDLEILVRKPLYALLCGAVLAPAIVSIPSIPANAAGPLDALDDPLYLRANPQKGTTLATPWVDEAKGASAFGFTDDLGSPFMVSTTPAPGLTAVHRLFNAATGDFTDALEGSGPLARARSAGYVDQGVRFYAVDPGSVAAGSTQPVVSYVKNGKHRLAVAGAGMDLTDSGWLVEGVAFHVAGKNAANKKAGVGALSPGASFYPAPSQATYVSTSGADAASGTMASPVRTIGRALSLAPAGGTVVVRAGTYRETLSIGKKVTLQPFPGEAVWLDGSSDVEEWAADGSLWRRDGWTQRFDHSPTYTQGAKDNTEPGWRFVNRETYPMAAHPDQVFVDGRPLQQVASKGRVNDDSFYLDEATSTLYMGTNPSRRTVAASTKHKAISVQAEGTVIRGLGIRRYAPSVFHMGAITVERPGVTLENVTITDSATTGLSVLSQNVTLDQVTVTGAGMLGIHGRFADNVNMRRVHAAKNNDEHFNEAPTAGGVKLGHTRGVTVVDSTFTGNYSYGFWEDLSVFDSVFARNEFTHNTMTGLFLEISAKAIVGDNLFANNDQFGLEVNNTSDTKVWNNTSLGGGRPVNLVQDTRRNTQRNDQAVDPRQPWPNQDMPWTLGPLEVSNNVIVNPTKAANCMLCVEDYSRQHTAEQMKITVNGNVYNRESTGKPSWLAVWSRGTSVHPFVFNNLSAFRSATGQEARGIEYTGASIVDSQGNLNAAVKAAAAKIALPLPADVASAIDRPVGSRSLGRW